MILPTPEGHRLHMTDDPIIYLATMKIGGADIQVRPTNLTMDGYGAVLASMVSATVNMFESAGVPRNEALDTILKRLNREARNPKVTAVYSSTNLQ